MSDTELIYILAGVIGTPLIAGITWLCTKKCKNQKCYINSGCCKISSEEHIRSTIREEVQIIINELRTDPNNQPSLRTDQNLLSSD